MSRFGRYAVAPFQPCQHGFADMDTAVVDDIGLDHAITVGLQYFCQAVSQQIVADVPQVERLVGVGR